MTEAARPIDPLGAALPEYSADWRFLLPIRAGAHVLILSDSWPDFSAPLAGLEMHTISCRVAGTGSPSDLRKGGEAGGTWIVANPIQLPFGPGSLDAIVIPFGIPERLLSPGSGTSLIGGLKQLLRPGGVLLLGLSNHWGFLRRGPRMGIAMAPASIRRLLQRAGFGRFSLYGAVPNLDKPAYILPLRKRPLQFFMRHRFLGRPSAALLPIFSLPLISRLVPRFLPCYFLLAGV